MSWVEVKLGNKAGLGYVDIPEASPYWGLTIHSEILDNSYVNFLVLSNSGAVQYLPSIIIAGKNRLTESLQVGENRLEFSSDNQYRTLLRQTGAQSILMYNIDYWLLSTD